MQHTKAEILEARWGKKSRFAKKDQQQVSKPKKLSTHLCYNCRQPRHFAKRCPHPKQQNQNPRADKENHGKKPIIQVKQGQLNFVGNVSIREHLPTSSFTFEYRDDIRFKGGML
jgi:hypothetical protein